MNNQFCFMVDGDYNKVDIRNTKSINRLQEAIRIYKKNIEDMKNKIEYCKLRIKELKPKT